MSSTLFLEYISFVMLFYCCWCVYTIVDHYHLEWLQQSPIGVLLYILYVKALETINHNVTTCRLVRLKYILCHILISNLLQVPTWKEIEVSIQIHCCLYDKKKSHSCDYQLSPRWNHLLLLEKKIFYYLPIKKNIVFNLSKLEFTH